jgi:hypothetical protein
MRIRGSWAWCRGFALGALLCSSGCGGSDGGGTGAPTGAATGGQITAEWQSYCVATFTREYSVLDPFGDVTFTAHASEAYLMTAYENSFSKDHAGLVYLTPSGPYGVDVDVDSGTRAFPFTTGCVFGSVSQYYAAFTDVSLYDTAQLSTKLCALSAGTVLPLDATSPAGFGATGASFNGPATYQVFLNAFKTQCGGAASGFVSVPETQVLGTTTWLVPIISIIGPR